MKKRGLGMKPELAFVESIKLNSNALCVLVD